MSPGGWWDRFADEPEDDHRPMMPLGVAIQRALVIPHMGQAVRPHCESPIEVILGAQLLAHMLAAFEGRAHLGKQEDIEAAPKDSVCLVPQYRFGRYRYDFAIGCPSAKVWVFIECDGRDFHITPEQIANDKRKDDIAAKVGIPVLRFTGSDIHKNGSYCASLVIQKLTELLKAEVA